MTKFVLNGLFEENSFWKEQIVVIKSRVVGFVFLVAVYIQVVEVLHYVSQKFNSFPLFSLPFLKKLKAFLHILLTSRKKNKNYFLKNKISAKLFLYSSIFHNCAQINLYNCIVFGKKRFH